MLHLVEEINDRKIYSARFLQQANKGLILGLGVMIKQLWTQWN